MTDDEARDDLIDWLARRAAERQEKRNPYPPSTREADLWSAAYKEEASKRAASS